MTQHHDLASMTAGVAARLLEPVEELSATVEEQQRTIDHLITTVEEQQRIIEALVAGQSSQESGS